MKAPETLQEAIIYFSDPHRAFDYAVKLRWPDGRILCPRCGWDKHSFIKTRRIWFCSGCKKQFTVKIGTVFGESPIGLDKWMTAVWMLVNCKNGISSHELGRALGVTQKSAWFMLQRVRHALRDRRWDGKLGGGPSNAEREVEIDETFVGGKIRNMHKDRRLRYQQSGAHFGKTIVMGMLDRDIRKVRATVIPDVKRETLQAQVLQNVKKGSTIYTDEHVGYERLRDRFVHDVVAHSQEYVRGRVHTNGVENFWSLLKRGLTGTYVAVEPFHLNRYVDEQVFRFNNRKDDLGNKLSDGNRFTQAMSQVASRRLSYAELTGKDESPRYETTGTGETQVPF